MTNEAVGTGDADRLAHDTLTSQAEGKTPTDSDGHTGGAPWYADGLRFTCTQCGDCCSGAPGAVWITEEELAAIAAEQGRAIGEVRLLDTKLIAGRWSLRDYPNGDCVYLDPATRRCRVYRVRPSQCRTWPFWSSNLETPEDWKRTCAVCPGSGTGELVPLVEIQQRLSTSSL